MDGNCGGVLGRVEVTGCVLGRVESDKPKKKEIKKEDPYGGSTDENTDAEEEQDQPIPELPGNSPSSSQSLTTASTFPPPLDNHQVPCLSFSFFFSSPVFPRLPDREEVFPLW